MVKSKKIWALYFKKNKDDGSTTLAQPQMVEMIL